MQLVENIKLTSNYCTIYESTIDGTPLATGSTSAINFVDTFHDCKMKVSAIKTIKKAANIIVAISRKKHYSQLRAKVGCTSYRNQDVVKNAAKAAKNGHLATFVTLTLPSVQNHTDTELTKYCLNPFLVYARKYYHVRYYIWKKELQENGNLHYHLMLDRYIDAKSLRKTWNKIINKGYVEGVNNPFDYVERYHNKWIDFYKNGLNRDDLKKYISKLPSIRAEIDKLTEFSSYQEYLQIEANIIERELNKYIERYNAEMKITNVDLRFRNPNTTDIQAVKSPKLISAYLAKYISKDLEATPKLIEYWKMVEYYKNQIYLMLKEIAVCKDENKDYSEILKLLADYKQYLHDYRVENCPIIGNLWYKSATLTPFLKGTSTVIYSKLGNEIDQLISWLKNVEKIKNKKRAEKGLKPISLIRYVYAKNNDGTDDYTKVICVTLLVNCFELTTTRQSNGSVKFPLLSRMWSMFFNKCFVENYKRGYYDVKE